MATQDHSGVRVQMGREGRGALEGSAGDVAQAEVTFLSDAFASQLLSQPLKLRLLLLGGLLGGWAPPFGIHTLTAVLRRGQRRAT